MLYATIGQIYVFLWMVPAGFVIGALYDIFRLIRRLLRAGTALSLLLDLTWGALSGAAFACMLVTANRGVPRLYTAVAAAIGCALYAAAVSEPAARAAGRLAALSKRAVTKLSQFKAVKMLLK